MAVFEYIREPNRLSLLWRAGLANFAVFAAVFLLFVAAPITIHDPIHLTEALVLAGGLAALFVVNLLLVRRALAPLDTLANQMSQVDLRDPDPHVAEAREYGPVLTGFVDTFNAMLARLSEERRAGARAALAAQERERLRIGRALHDEAGQTLTAIALEIERAATQGPLERREQMDALASQLHGSLDEIRRISRDLRPEALDDLGLVNALIALIRRLDRHSDMAIQRRLSSALPPLSSELELVIYRVAQEALTNVLRHSRASRCVVTLEVEAEQHVVLCVVDDGIGLPRDLPRDTIGIEGMRERALLGNGTLTISSPPGGGTAVMLKLPTNEMR